MLEATKAEGLIRRLEMSILRVADVGETSLIPHPLTPLKKHKRR